MDGRKRLTVRLRRACAADVPAMLDIREALRLRPGAPVPSGGFLLGCSEARYRLLVERADVLVLEIRGQLSGFAVTLPDPVLRASELWARRDRIVWGAGHSEPPPNERIAYFDQLALAPTAARLHAPMLALAALRTIAEQRHGRVYATTLRAPMPNSAAVPLIAAAGGRVVGQVTEEYEEVGEVTSDLYEVLLPEGMAAALATSAGTRTISSLRLAA
ncbi:MAG TPA: hypothetical protein VGX37_03840 [Allosphingosinicella sp.]|jgi:hypothetical protein|nr:hypothetical protein [Allosphingosinicella sp.]